MYADNAARAAAMAHARLAEIAECSADGPGVTRLPFTRQHQQALDLLTGWMRDAGLTVHIDAAGTLIGHRAGPQDAPTLLIGSHQDSIRQGGAYDGILGIILPLCVLHHMQDVDLPYGIDLLAFADEEGVRFPTALMGPRCLAGTFDNACLDGMDADGITLRRAMADFGCDPAALPSLKRDPASLLGYLELHIEQGPLLEANNLPAGVVTGICGIERHAIEITGMPGHAGTVPMHLRRDALAAAAALILAVEQHARDTDGLLALVGEIAISPNAVNVIPGKAMLPIEIRAADDDIRAQAAMWLSDTCRVIAQERGVEITHRKTYGQPGVICDQALSDLLGQALIAADLPDFRLLSGATHDASAMADLCPVAMLFLRCRNGLSHHPDEYVSPADLKAGCTILAHALSQTAQRSSEQPVFRRLKR